MTFDLTKIYPITDVSITGISHLEQAKRMIAGGARLIQLREKNASPSSFYDAALDVMKFARERNVKIIINDRVDIALAIRADGVHLGQDDLPPMEARRILGENAIIGFSTHSIEQARRASEMPVDYLAFGPIFRTKTKADADPIVGIGGLREVRRAIDELPLVAIGGIQPQNIAELLANGADSVALISAILLPPEKITEKFRELLKQNP